jgi:hypothetical protein
VSHEQEPGRLQPDARFLGDLGTVLEAGLTPVIFLLVVNIVLLIAGASAGNDQSRHALADDTVPVPDYLRALDLPGVTKLAGHELMPPCQGAGYWSSLE